MKRNQDGFTLLEVLVAVSLLGVVFGVVSAAFVVSLEVSEDSTQRLSESQAAAVTSSWWTRDVQSAQTITVGTASCPGVSGMPVLTATWQDEGATGGTKSYVVDYRLDAGSLVRTSCGSGPTTHSVATSVLSAQASCPSTPCAEVRLALKGVGDASFTISARRRIS